MKMYEGLSNSVLLPGVPIVVRLDGKCFSSWTRGLNRPYDIRLITLMRDVTMYLMNETNATIGYTQSDEISLVLYNPDHRSDVLFGGRSQKIISVLASMATAFFNARVKHDIKEKEGKLAFFDARVFCVPSPEEAANAILWREQDATRNSVQSAARSVYSHKDCHGRSSAELMDMLHSRGINWNNYPDSFKRGSFFQKKTVFRKLSTSELETLPPLHHARRNPDMEIERNIISVVSMPPFGRVTNRAGVVCFGEHPEVAGAALEDKP